MADPFICAEPERVFIQQTDHRNISFFFFYPSVHGGSGKVDDISQINTAQSSAILNFKNNLDQKFIYIFNVKTIL